MKNRVKVNTEVYTTGVAEELPSASDVAKADDMELQ